MWFSLALGVVSVVVILALAFDRSRLAKENGEKDERIRVLESTESWLRAALVALGEPDPDLDDLDRMYDEDAPTAP